MHLVMISPLPMEQLRPLAVQKFFNRCQLPSARARVSLRTDSARTAAPHDFYQTDQRHQTTLIDWEIPRNLPKTWIGKAPELIAYVLGQEGENSLIAELKKEKIAEGINVDL